jgi:hypothetical protein
VRFVMPTLCCCDIDASQVGEGADAWRARPGRIRESCRASHEQVRHLHGRVRPASGRQENRPTFRLMLPMAEVITSDQTRRKTMNP